MEIGYLKDTGALISMKIPGNRSQMGRCQVGHCGTQGDYLKDFVANSSYTKAEKIPFLCSNIRYH